MNTEQRSAILSALIAARNSDGGLTYIDENDDCGNRACCGVVSYENHAPHCWIHEVNNAISIMEQL